jgi:hypothetical protein
LPNYINKIIIFLIIILFISCSDTKVSEQNILKIERFEKIFYESDSSSISEVKSKYPFFFPDNFPDEIFQFKNDINKKEADVFFIYPTLLEGKKSKRVEFKYLG